MKTPKTETYYLKVGQTDLARTIDRRPHFAKESTTKWFFKLNPKKKKFHLTILASRLLESGSERKDDTLLNNTILKVEKKNVRPTLGLK